MNSVRIALLSATMLLGGLGTAFADTVCPPSLGAVTVENVVVVPGARCTLNGTIVQGNVSVEAGGILRAINGARVDGSIQSQDAAQIALSRVFVGGDVQLDRTVGTASVVGSMVGGSVQIEDGSGPVAVRTSNVEGDVQLNANTAGITALSNVIGGNLQCQSNTPPIRSAGNVVEGNFDGQCTR